MRPKESVFGSDCHTKFLTEISRRFWLPVRAVLTGRARPQLCRLRVRSVLGWEQGDAMATLSGQLHQPWRPRPSRPEIALANQTGCVHANMCRGDIENRERGRALDGGAILPLSEAPKSHPGWRRGDAGICRSISKAHCRRDVDVWRCRYRHCRHFLQSSVDQDDRRATAEPPTSS